MNLALRMLWSWVSDLLKLAGMVAILGLCFAIASSWQDARKVSEKSKQPASKEQPYPTGHLPTSKVSTTSLYIPDDVLSQRGAPLWL